MWERLFKQLYNLGIVVNLCAFVISFTDYSDRIDNTFASFWSSQTFTLAAPLMPVLENCSYTGVFNAGPYSTPSSLSLASAPLPFILVTAFLLGTFVIYALLIVMMVFAALMHTWNVRYIRIRGLRFQLHSILVSNIVGLSGCMLILLNATRDVRYYLNDYVSSCASKFLAAKGDQFLAAEYDTNVVFGTNMNWCIAAVVVHLATYMLAGIFLVHTSMKSSHAKLEQATHPWERGVLCRPDKLKLVYYTRQRDELLEELAEDPSINSRTMGAFPFPNSHLVMTNHQQQQHDPVDPAHALGQRAQTIPASAISRQQQRRLLEQHAAQYTEFEEPQVIPEFAGDGEEFNPDEEAQDGGDRGRQHRHRKHHRRVSPTEGAGVEGVEEQPQEEGGEEGERRHRRRHRRRKDKLDEAGPLDENE